MRLLDFGQKPDYVPHERGDAFPQFHEDGDKAFWCTNMCWNYRFWIHGVWEMGAGHNNFDPAYLMGGEL